MSSHDFDMARFLVGSDIEEVRRTTIKIPPPPPPPLTNSHTLLCTRYMFRARHGIPKLRPQMTLTLRFVVVVVVVKVIVVVVVVDYGLLLLVPQIINTMTPNVSPSSSSSSSSSFSTHSDHLVEIQEWCVWYY